MESVKVGVIIPAAGFGRRMGSAVAKQYIEVQGKPILVYTLEAFEICHDVHEIVLVVGEKDVQSVQKDIVNKYGLTKVKAVISGGDQRQDSVYKGIQAISKEVSIIMVHDGARPMIRPSLISKLVDETKVHPACILGVQVKDTIKQVDVNGMVVDTPDRAMLYQIQTPQSFESSLIRSVYQMGIKRGFEATDDAMMVEKFGDVKVKIIQGAYDNRKITTLEDLKWMKHMIK